MAEARLYLCPRCGSLEIYADHLTPLGQLYKCPACAYQGAFVIEADSPEEAKALSDKIAEGEPEDEPDPEAQG